MLTRIKIVASMMPHQNPSMMAATLKEKYKRNLRL